MFTKWSGYTVSALLLASVPFAVSAAPKLTMHVFDAEPVTANNNVQTRSPSPVSNNQPAVAVDKPAKKPETLKLHIYDRRPQKTPPLSYDMADVYLKAGYRRDDLQWNKAGLGGHPNILSELTWEDIEIATINLGATFYLRNSWFVNGDVVWGEIVDGDNQDSDYWGNNRTMEFSRSNNGADEGNILDLSLAVGYRYDWLLDADSRSHFELRPKIGLAYHSQNLKAVDGYQTIPALGPFPGLDSSYDTSWFGPWAGLETVFYQDQRFKLGLNLEYHYVSYDAEAQWNLRSDLAQPTSFEHEADGSGWVAEINTQWYFTPDLALTLDLQYQQWLADRNGKDKMYFADGSEIQLKFNEADWESYGVSLGLNYDF